MFFVGRAFNTVGNIYLASQVGWWAYKQVREMKKEKLQADELKANFIAEYKQDHDGEEPSEVLIFRSLESV